MSIALALRVFEENMSTTEKPAETIDQKQARQLGALCRFAGAVEKLAKSTALRDSQRLHGIRKEIKKLNVEMEWEELP